MSTPFLLVDELAAFLEGVTANFEMTTPSGKIRSPKVTPGWLPLKDPKNKDEEDFPYVLVRYIGHSDKSEGESTAKIHIFAGVYSMDPQGWRELVNPLERIRQALLKKRTLAKKFRLVLPMESKIPPHDQPFPEWVGWLETEWTIPQPVEEVVIDGESY